MARLDPDMTNKALFTFYLEAAGHQLAKIAW